jgi:outer membrane protein OmpA-like peptidoglycan-associated protein
MFTSDFVSRAILSNHLGSAMSAIVTRRRIFCGALATLALGQLIFAEEGLGGQPDVEEEADRIARALTPRVRRGLGEVDHSAEQQTIDRLKTVRLKRGGLNLQERDELYEAARPLPQVAMEIRFAFDSAELLPEARPRLDALGQALARPNLQGNNILLTGHTDRKGSAEYNLKLSERRVASVVDYLSSKFSLDRNKLTAIGYGFEKLKNPNDPLAAENRRVEIVNAGTSGPQ